MFEDIIGAYPAAHIIACQDVSTQINSGVFIVRRSAWAVYFLELWRQEARVADIQLTDQEGFDRVYSSLGSAARRKVVILPGATMNTVLPAMLTYSRTQPIVHLAAEIDLYRVSVFKPMFELYCAWRNRNITAASSHTEAARPGSGTLASNIGPAPVFNLSADSLVQSAISM